METFYIRPPRKRYSETLRKLAPILAQHVEGAAIMRALAIHERQTGGDGEFDIAEAMYWIGANYHGGQSCPLYAAMCATRFTPGMCARGPEKGSSAADLYEEIETLVSN